MRTIEEISADLNTAFRLHDPDKLDELSLELRSIDHPKADARSIHALGMAAVLREEYASALHLVQRSTELATDAGNEDDAMDCRYLMGVIHQQTGRLQEAINEYAITRQHYLANNIDEKLAVVESNIGRTLVSQGNVDSGLLHLQQAITVSSRIGSRYTLASAHEFTGYALLKCAEIEGAFRHCHEALSLYEELDLPYGIAHTCLTLALIYSNVCDYSPAIECVERALSLSQKLNLNSLMASCVSHLATLHSRSGNEKGALRYYSESLQVYQTANDSLNAVICQNNIAKCHAALGDYDQAMSMFRESLRAAREMRLTVQEADCMESMIELCLIRSDYLEAKRLHDSLNVDTITNPVRRAYYFSQQSRIVEQAQNLEGAHRLLMKCLDELRNSGRRDKMVQTHEMIRDLAERRGDLKTYVMHNKEHLRLRSELESEELSKRLALRELERMIDAERHSLDAERRRRKMLEDQLAINAVQMANQAEVVFSFKRDLQGMIREAEDPYTVLRNISTKMRDLPFEMIDWLRFEKEFTELHPDFIGTLLEKYPSLTKQEVKMCQLTRIGLKSHEIARILCLSDRSVDNHRYNIRKKLGMQTKDSLTDFLRAM